MATISELPSPPDGKTGWPWNEAPEFVSSSPPEGGKWPKITIVSPSYNQGQFIEATIRSVLLQGYPELEYIVLDGGSTDQTVSVLEKYDPWIDYWQSQPDGGQSSAINAGFQKASGTLGTWLNSDDVFFPRTLRTVGRYFAEEPSCRFFTGDGVLTDEQLEEVQHMQRPNSYSKRELLNYPGGQYLPQPSVFFDLALFEEVGGVQEDLHYTMDLDLWLRMRERARLYYLPERLSMTRKHANTKTHGNNQKALREAGAVIRHHAPSLASPYVLSVLLRLRARQAEGFASQALDQYFSDSHVSAAIMLGRSLLQYPPVVLTRLWSSVLVRLILPASVQSLFFHRY
jgi:hypothetical protein